MPHLLDLIVEPNILLHNESAVVDAVTPEIQELLDNMLYSMYHYDGVGLAAVQVGVLQKVIVIDVGTENSQGVPQPMQMINAEITNQSNAKASFQEGCLSFPGLYTEIERPSDISVKFLDRHGIERQYDVEHGLLSVCIQHEIDHTNGKVFVDHLSKLKKELLITKMLKDRKKKPS